MEKYSKPCKIGTCATGPSACGGDAMKPKPQPCDSFELFQAHFDQILNPDHELIQFARPALPATMMAPVQFDRPTMLKANQI